MTATLSDPRQARAYIEFLHPQSTKEGLEPESRVVHCGVSWEDYLAFDKALGDDRPGPRIYYLDGDLEIMTTSSEHERIKKWLDAFMTIYFDEVGIEVVPHGQTTMREGLARIGAEPDESWCLHHGKPYPDLVLEIALTSGGVRKLDLYLQFQIPEVWIWRRGKLSFCLARRCQRVRSSRSRTQSLAAQPGFSSVGAVCGNLLVGEARLAFREGLAAGK